MKHPDDLQIQIRSVLQGGDILLLVPPFATAKNPVLGVHILQSLAEERGYAVDVLYLNVLLASVMGFERFEEISVSPFETLWRMLHERLFARSAYHLPPLGHTPQYCAEEALSLSGDPRQPIQFYDVDGFDLEEYLRLETLCYRFVEDTVAALAPLHYQMIGCTVRMGQTNCSIALLNRLKQLHPDALTLLGGTNCKGELAQGMASLSSAVDYIFSGDSERAFDEFLEGFARGELPTERVLTGEPLLDMDGLPFPKDACFFEQTVTFRGQEALSQTARSYETSRGCWWGERRGCHFCSEREAFRLKTSFKVLKDFQQMGRDDQPPAVYMCDIAMPPVYHQEVFPKLLEEPQCPHIHYQAKANLDLRDLIRLKQANIEQFTIGIEALSSGFLKLMNKGVSVRQNLQLLRYARSLGLYIDWLLLWGFPGDRAEDYQETLALLPLLRHLQPPVTCLHLVLARFSTYFEHAPEFRIANIRPWAVYQMIYPAYADLEHLAYWFTGDYPCAAHEQPELIQSIVTEVERWKRVWKTSYLVLIPWNDGYAIFDHREDTGNRQLLVEVERARALMKPAPYEDTEHQRWAIEARLGVLMDSWYVPLVTAEPDFLLQFEEEE